YVDFPAVTVCRTNGAHGFARLQDISKKNVADTVKDKTDLWAMLNPNIMTRMMDETDNIKKLTRAQAISQHSPKMAQYLAPKYETFIVSCRFKGKKCNKTNFIKRMNGEYFKCFTFNNSATIKNVGPRWGLSLTFYLDRIYGIDLNYDMDAMDITEYGVKVSIHEPNTIPDMVNNAITISPGYNTKMALRQTVFGKMEHPWGQCDKFRVKLVDIAYEATNIAYNQDTCLKICQQRYIQGKCGCLNIMRPVPNDLLNETYCSDISDNNESTIFLNDL
ncbi:unnamed protein product, partial [Owenia fusiformis]